MASGGAGLPLGRGGSSGKEAKGTRAARFQAKKADSGEVTRRE